MPPMNSFAAIRPGSSVGATASLTIGIWPQIWRRKFFCAPYRNLDKYRGDCRFSTWLYVIARNLCFTALQKRASEPVWIAKSQSTELPDLRAVDLHAAFEMEESRLSNWRFILQTLDETEARVMLLHYGQELPLSDISRMLV